MRPTPAAFSLLVSTVASRAVSHGPLTPRACPVGSSGGTWTTLPPIASGPAQEHGTAALNDTIFILGGNAPPSADGGVSLIAAMHAYSLSTGKWTDAPPLLVPMNHPNAAASPDGKTLLLLGGLTAGAQGESVWYGNGTCASFDPVGNKWVRMEPMPEGQERGAAAIGVDPVRGNVILAGGLRTNAYGPGGIPDTVATVTSYDVASRSWRTLPPLPEGRDHAGGAVVDRTFFVVGGRFRGRENIRDTVFALDLDAPEKGWTSRAKMPTARGGVAVGVVKRKIMVLGGEGNKASEKGIFDQVEVYDVTTDTWEALGPMPVPRHGTAAAVIDGKVYIPGGGVRQGGAAVDVFDVVEMCG